jgi:hypothetical protein
MNDLRDSSCPNLVCPDDPAGGCGFFSPRPGLADERL